MTSGTSYTVQTPHSAICAGASEIICWAKSTIVQKDSRVVIQKSGEFVIDENVVIQKSGGFVIDENGNRKSHCDERGRDDAKDSEFHI